MIILSIITVFFLAIMLGRNNLSNLFGSAVGTRMLSFQTSALIASIFVIFGAVFSGSAVTQNVTDLGDVQTLQDAFTVCFSAGILLWLLGKSGCPASVVQTTTGSYVAYNFFYHAPQPITLLTQSISGWIYTPIIGCFLSFFGFKFFRYLLHRFPVRLLLRDKLIRMGLLSVGAFSAYAFGANNIGSVIGPMVNLNILPIDELFYGTGLFIALGFFFADRRVIETVSTGVFKLSPTEALIAVFMSAVTLLCFSSVTLERFLTACHLPTFPLVPVPLSGVLIGAVFGIALSKGPNGLKWKKAGTVIFSWFMAPTGSGIICYILLLLMKGR